MCYPLLPYPDESIGEVALIWCFRCFLNRALDCFRSLRFLVLGGLFTTYLALDVLSNGNGWMQGFDQLLDAAPDRFHMILEESNPEYNNLPGIWVLVGLTLIWMFQ